MGAMIDERTDEVEIRRVLAVPFANGQELRDAVEVVINGERLSDLLDGVGIDVFQVRRELAGPWTSGGARVPVGVCGCGHSGSGAAQSAPTDSVPSERR